MNRIYNMLSRIYLIISFDSAPLRYALKSGKCNFEKQFHMAISNNFVFLNKKILTCSISENKIMLLSSCHRYLLIALILEALSCLTAKWYRYFYQIVNVSKIWEV